MCSHWPRRRYVWKHENHWKEAVWQSKTAFWFCNWKIKGTCWLPAEVCRYDGFRCHTRKWNTGKIFTQFKLTLYVRRSVRFVTVCNSQTRHPTEIHMWREQLTAMLTIKRLAGVPPDVNPIKNVLRIHLHQMWIRLPTLTLKPVSVAHKGLVYTKMA